MADRELRRQIAFEAARLLYEGEVRDYPQAKRRGARRLGYRFRPRDLPSNREVREQLGHMQEAARACPSPPTPRQRRLEALRVMRLLRPFSPRLVIHHADTPPEVHVRVECSETVERRLEEFGVDFMASSPRGPNQAWIPLRTLCDLPCTVVVRPSDDPGPNGDSMDLDALLRLLQEERPDIDLEAELEGLSQNTDRFETYRHLLTLLEEVRLDPQTHPEGDALYHSLQVFDLAFEHRPYDEEFLTAALVHDVGKAVDRSQSTAETLQLLEGLVTHRTRWLIEHLGEGKSKLAGDLPIERRRVLEASDDYEDLLLLAELDLLGRRPGVAVPTLEEALERLRSMDSQEAW